MRATTSPWAVSFPSAHSVTEITILRPLGHGVRPTDGGLDIENPALLDVTGTGKSFCSGVDLKEMGAQQQLGLEERRKDILGFYKKATCFLDLAVPVIAAINGHAIGAGCALALACDMRIAAQGARLGLGFVKIGLHPGAGTTCILPRLVGTAKACELVMTGDLIDADEAARIGMLNRVVPAEELQAASLELAAKIAKGPPIPMKMIKKAIYQGQRDDLHGPEDSPHR